jgi:hypothetical protein
MDKGFEHSEHPVLVRRNLGLTVALTSPALEISRLANISLG